MDGKISSLKKYGTCQNSGTSPPRCLTGNKNQGKSTDENATGSHDDSALARGSDRVQERDVWRPNEIRPKVLAVGNDVARIQTPWT